jgi:adenylosuccinate lyase
VDGILSLYINIVDNGVVYPKMAEKHLREELPFMATENILMYCVERGGDRQALHEEIRKLSVETAKNIKLNGGDNDILEKIAADKAFGITKEELNKVLDGFSFTGIAEEQTEDFIQKFVTPVLEKNASLLGVDVKISV